MSALLWRAGIRHHLRQPVPSLLAILGVALGVAVVTGIDLANDSARRGFADSVDAVAGRATHELAGGPSGLDQALYRQLRVEDGWRRAAPIIDVRLRLPEPPRRGVRLLGVDPLAEPDVRRRGAFALDVDLQAFFGDPGGVLIDPSLARALGVAIGDRMALTGSIDVLVLGMLGRGEGTSAGDLLVADIATAQRVAVDAGVLGAARISRVDLLVEGAGADAQLSRLQAGLPAGVRLVAKASRSDVLDQMTSAFRLNLQALSLLALVVGGFLIYNTMTFAVVKRRRTIGMQRALGVSRRQVLAVIVGEALVIGLLGTALGIGLGVLLANVLLDLVVRTINDLYFVLAVRGLTLAPLTLVKALLLGQVATVVAAWRPARQAAETAPRAAGLRSAFEAAHTRALPRLAVLGGVLLVLAAAILALSGRSLAGGFAGVFAVVLGFAALVPPAVALASRAARPVLTAAFGLLGAMAATGVHRNLSRTGVATTALVIAVSVTVGVGAMVHSFRATLIDWLGTTLRADVYVRAVGIGSGRGTTTALDPAVLDRLRAVPGTAWLATYRRIEAPSPDGTVQLQAIDLVPPARAGFRFVEGDPEAAFRAFDAGEGMLVSEPFAFHRQLGVGDTVTLDTDRGRHTFAIAGVYVDYASDRGATILPRSTYERFYDDRAVQSAALYVRDGTDAETWRRALTEAAGAATGADGTAGQDVVVEPRRGLRDQAVAIFDRTFTVTAVLRLLAVAVAFVGVLAALMALQLDRRREIAVLRAQGLTPGQVWALVTTECGLLGTLAGMLSLPLGALLAALLVHVINRRAFGWSLLLDVPPWILAQGVLLALAAALLAGLYPAWAMARTAPAGALREER